MGATKLSTVERLRIAGAIAPAIRDTTKPKRLIKTYDPATGKPVRVVDQREVLQALAAKREIEIAVPPGKRPEWIRCAALDEHGDRCAQFRKVPKRGEVPKWCVECCTKKKREQSRAWRAANREQSRERSREQMRAWRAANREKSREQSRAWRAANREKDREQSRAWRAANPEKKREQDRARRAANPEKSREQSRAWRARKKAEREAMKAGEAAKTK